MGHKLAIIGGGNLGTALMKGFILSSAFGKTEILISDKSQKRIQELSSMGYQVSDDNTAGIASAKYILVAVKPQQIAKVIKEINPHLQKNQIILYTVTGVNMQEVASHIDQKLAIGRIMPNTAAEVCESVTCTSFLNASQKQEKEVNKLLENIGVTIPISEDLMPAATVVGACGIAFAMKFMRASMQGGVEMGFSAEMAQLIAAQTAKGAVKLLMSNQTHPESEIDKVTTPQGITISGLNEMEHQGFSSALIRGLLTSYNKLIKIQE